MVDLQLPTMAEAFQAEVEAGPRPDDTRYDLLHRLLKVQLQRRRENATARRIKAARFPASKSLDDFDFDFQKQLDRSFVMELATIDFVRRGYNLLVGGASGTGKSHICISLGHLACAQNLSVRYTTSADMLRTLFAALATNSLADDIKPFTRCQLLIIDEVGLDRTELDRSRDAQLFYKVVQSRYDDGVSTIITTNLEWDSWGTSLGGDYLATGALLDRLIHRGYLLKIDGPSWRAHQHKKLNQRSAAKNGPEP
jgi:DNA replication protein DnaC